MTTFGLEQLSRPEQLRQHAWNPGDLSEAVHRNPLPALVLPWIDGRIDARLKTDKELDAWDASIDSPGLT